MTDWNPDALHTFGDADEIDIAPHRADGSLRPYTTIWAVRSGDELYVRSLHGADGGWYRRALASGQASLRTSSRTLDVTVTTAPTEAEATITEAYRSKYGHSPYLDPMIADQAVRATALLRPA